ncbi:hypothetical protein EDEG_03848 [Edhazardia aedis USNM 41457]|uniref:Exocyst complex component Sec3 coiled-coil domain-containing protein n=1 Tax=Edhazardia aedis (strain USNM 41457) TaxID=1003232 RepID=J9DG89_EDHAE|nr:hypothetical protein EDEG_03848 [Edhazardia aedis USNM 41457]|eukprot:EJW01605.1 hypothetical protein EDEG_03848 [Edhazardia aedis USNM 41457]
MRSEEIDRIFVDSEEKEYQDVLVSIDHYIKNSNEMIQRLEQINVEAHSFLDVYNLHRIQLQTLGNEIENIGLRNKQLKIEIQNATDVLNALEVLIKSVEIKKEHFDTLNDPNFHELANIRISLMILKEFNTELNIKIVSEQREKISTTIKMFLKKFILYLERIFETYENESTGELKIHSKIYDELKKLEFIINFCKHDHKDKFIIITQKYLNFAKNLYEAQFENHLGIILKALKRYTSPILGTKMPDIIQVLLESFSILIRSENAFVRRIFFDKKEFINDFIKNMFSDVSDIILDFLRDCFKNSKIITISSIFRNKDLTINFEGEKNEFYLFFQEKLSKLHLEFEQEYLNSIDIIWKNQSKQKTVTTVVSELINNKSSRPFTKNVVDYLIRKIKDLQRDTKGKIEFCLYRLKFIFDIRNIGEYALSETNIIEKELTEELEKEVVSYVLCAEEKKIKSKLKNIRALIKEISKDDESYRLYCEVIIKEILYKSISNEQLEAVNSFFNM